MNSKKIIFILIFSTLIVAILTANLLQVSVENKHRKKEIEILNTRLDKMKQKMHTHQVQMENVDFLTYRDKVVRKKYPVFSRIVDVVYYKSKEYGFNPNLILSLIQIESNFKPRAISSKGAYGLMQVNYSVWKEELDIDNLRIFNIEYNIDLGMQILKRYYDEARGDLLKTLHLYNNGYLHNNQKYKHKVVSSVFY
ncbi:MAG: lytic transglycosylase domain-containing protein [Candidatus Aminicenantes bacterium]|nr:lytic transglycosylase domain-containing protein [Candidatus Aminicenantes bacterium]